MAILDDTTYSDDPLYREVIFDNYDEARKWYEEEAPGYGVDTSFGRANWFTGQYPNVVPQEAFKVQLGYDPDEAYDRGPRMVPRSALIPPVSDYSHYNEEAYSMWYAENRYDMEHGDEMVEIDEGW